MPVQQHEGQPQCLTLEVTAALAPSSMAGTATRVQMQSHINWRPLCSMFRSSLKNTHVIIFLKVK